MCVKLSGHEFRQNMDTNGVKCQTMKTTIIFIPSKKNCPNSISVDENFTYYFNMPDEC